MRASFLTSLAMARIAVGGVINHSLPELNNLSSLYTLTAYTLNDCTHNGLKVNNLNLFQAKVGQYCPFTGNQSYFCPNGTDMAFGGTLTPIVLVPGGQDLYVNVDGTIAITVQHSHSIPPGAWWNYYGWTWTALPVIQSPLHDCPLNNPEYNCEPPTGFWNFQAPNAMVGGVKACPNKYQPSVTSLYAVTPDFNRTDCIGLAGLGTHNYTGPSPPVWAY
ncbi:hypothetical protein EJ08DRAFT_207871 [Tothia fuscella]|uniref:Uncharacterized protein n=1 Tax=Tothia fuscella TaxID=1048955 RepID=A0A9P4NSU9_9PEZI|nr:hypothetical protein EJ08DRAFT_207871 [Tothia fuscella]